MKNTFIVLLCIFTFGNSIAQQATVRGIITDDRQQLIQNATVVSELGGTTSNENGFYSLQVQSKKNIQIIFQHIGYENRIVKLQLLPGEV